MSTLERFQLLNLSNLPWVPGRLKRNQAIFLHLLASQEWLSSGIFLNPPAVEKAPAKYYARPRLEVAGEESADGKPVVVLQPYYSLPVYYSGLLRDWWAGKLQASIRRLLTGPYLLWLNSIGRLQRNLADRLRRSADRVIFDCSDNMGAISSRADAANEQVVLGWADTVVCVNEGVAAAIDHPHKVVFRNSTHFPSFEKSGPDVTLPGILPKPPGARYIGFHGGIHESRADQALLTALFSRFPEATFLFAGYTDSPKFLDWLLRFPNVVFLPELPYDRLPALLRSFDVAIVPHRDNAVTRGNDLLKVLDYFACGVPVVSTPCSNVAEYREALYIAPDPEGFSRQVERLLAGGAHDPAPGLAVARERSWEKTVPLLADMLFGNPASIAIERPSVKVV